MNSKLYPWKLLVVTSIGVLLVMLNLSTLNVVLPVLSGYFQAGPVASSWILLSYMLFNSIFILVFGRLADIFGRRKFYLLGLGILTVVSLFCGFASNVWMLIVFRIIQAAGGALVITNTTPLITDAFSEARLGTALGINVLVSSASNLLGPVVGGYLVYALNWRWVFWFNVPVGIIGLILGFFVLKKTPSPKKKEAVDVFGSICILLGLGGLIYAISQGGVAGWTSSPVMLGIALFIVFGSVFAWWERRISYSTIDFSLFRNREYAMANIATFLNSFARSSVVLLIALFFQVMDKENTFSAGLKVLPVTIGMIIASPLVGLMSRRFSTLLLSTSGIALVGIGLVLLTLNMSATFFPFSIALGQFFVGFGSGVFMTPNTKSIMLNVPPNRRGTANGVRSMLQNVGTVLSTAISLMLVSIRLPARLKQSIYDGAEAMVDNADRILIAKGFQLAFEILFLVTLIALAVSYARGSKPRVAEDSVVDSSNYF